MKRYRFSTHVWIVLVAAAALVGTVAGTRGELPPHVAWLALGALAVCAAIAHLFPIRSAADGATASYQVTNVFLIAGGVVLPPSLITALVVLALTPQAWLRRDRPGTVVRWLFNVSQTVVAGQLAQAWVAALDLHHLGGVPDLVVLVGAGAVFTIAQAMLVGVAIALQSRIPLYRVETLSPAALLADGLIAVLGVLVAGLWLTQPVLLLLLPPVLVLAHRLTRTAHLAQLAEVDPKTGLYNARYFERVLEDELAHSRRMDRPLTLMFADLDHFKRVNDQHGHDAGDQVLREIASVLTSQVRSGDVVARYGGEEFVLLFPGTEPDEGIALGERLRRAVEEHTVALGGAGTLQCTISIGIAGFPEHATDLATLIKQADTAMYRAKITRNTIALTEMAQAVPRLLHGDLQPVAAPHGVPSANGTPRTTGVSDASRTAPAGGAAKGARVSGHAPKVPSAAPAPTATPRVRPAGRLVVWGTIAAGALIATWCVFTTMQAGLWLQIAPFLALAIGAELLGAQVYQSGRQRISLSFTIVVTMAAVTVLPLSAPLVSLTAAMLHSTRLFQRRQIDKALFNMANPAIAAAAASATYSVLQYAMAGTSVGLITSLVAALGAVLVFYTVNVGLISLTISLHANRPLRRVMHETSWFGPAGLVLGLTGAFLGLTHNQLGPVGMLVFIAPILVLRFTLTLFARQSERTIQTLQAAKAQIDQAHEEKEALLRKLIDTVASIIDARDNSVSGHSRRVAKYAVGIGKALGLGVQELAVLHTAGLFHDLGKVAVPEQILHKPSRLTDDEYHVIKRHAEVGEHILADVPQLADVARMVGEHHERFDGAGYPRRLAGPVLTIGGRILAVCDAIESMLADRPYSKSKPLSSVLQELDRCAGTHFDPEAVAAVHRVVEQHGPFFFTDAVDASDVAAVVPFAPMTDAYPEALVVMPAA
ncbi:MAG: diguanylate cyclase [Chloroflexi bacterium]|nr:diguanylate cyclase [Chloroflexota bacterium]